MVYVASHLMAVVRIVDFQEKRARCFGANVLMYSIYTVSTNGLVQRAHVDNVLWIGQFGVRLLEDIYVDCDRIL